MPHADPEVRRAYLAQYRRTYDLTGRPLTPTEVRVLTFAAEGYTTAGTATRLDMSEDNVKANRQRARQKLQAASTAQAVAIGISRGLLTLAEEPK